MGGFLEAIYGSKPSVPKLTPIDVGKEQQKAIENNLAALPSAEKLVQAQNQFSRGEIKNMLSAAGINYDAIAQTNEANIESMLRGEVPTDVSEAVQRSGAARALGGGFAGTEMHRDLTARDLGLVSLDLTGRGLNAAESWLHTAQSLFGPGEMDVKSMFVTPGFQTQVDIEERDKAFQREWMQSQIKAMPDPVIRGVYDTIGEMLSMVASIYGGKSQHQSYSPSQASSQVGGIGGADSSGGGWTSANYGGYDSMSYMQSMESYQGGDMAAGGGTEAMGAGGVSMGY